MLPSSLTTMTMGELPGFSVHLTTTAKIKSFDESFEENMRWLREVLEDAKRQFGREEMAIFPKTPAMKKRRRRIIRRVSTLHNDDMQIQPPVMNKRGSRTSIIGKAGWSREMAVPVRRSARNSARTTITTQKSRSRSGTSKKVQLTKDKVRPVQGLDSSDTSSCSEDITGTEEVSVKDEPKRSTDSGIITTAEAPMDTEECTKEVVLSGDTAGVKKPDADNPPSRKNSKRNTTSKGKQRSKKLRLNSGEGISTVSDSTTSDEFEMDHPAANSKSDLAKYSTMNSSSSTPNKDEENVISEPKPISDKTSTTGCPKRKNAASRYKDHVKRLINCHEHLIADQITSSGDEFQSPTCKQVAKEPVQKIKQPAWGKKKQGKSVAEEVNQSIPEKQKVIIEEKMDDEVFHAVDTVEKQLQSKTEKTQERIKEQGSHKACPSVETAHEQHKIPEAIKSDEEIPTKIADILVSENPLFHIEPEEIEKPSDDMSEGEVEVRIDEDSLNQHSIAEDSLEQCSMITEDSVNNKTSENPNQSTEVGPDQANMTTDSLDQQNITQDSLDHNNISYDSLNQSTSRACMTRQSLRKNLRQSTLRSSVAVSHSKKRSSVHHRRTSIRKSLRHSVRNPHSTRASTRVSMRRATMEEAPQQETVGYEDQDVVMEEALLEEDAEDSPKEGQATLPTRISTSQLVINEEKQRITRAASRIAEKQEMPPDEQQISSQTPEFSYNSTRAASRIAEKQEMPPDEQQISSQTPEFSYNSTPNMSHDGTSSSDDDIVCKTPSPQCPSNKVVRPRGTFLSSGKKEPRYLNNLHGMVSSFIKRNTPQKQTTMERQQEIKRNILNKQKRDEEIRRKLEADKQNQRELQKRKRDERIKKVTEARERRAALQEQKRHEIAHKQQQASKMTTKQREDKKQEETQRKQMLMKKKAEADERRRQEEQTRMIKIQEQEEEQRRHNEMILRKREYEERERQRRIEEARHLQELRRAEVDRQRQDELQRRREVELAKERELQLLKQEREHDRKLEMEHKRELERRAREEVIEKERCMEAERIVREQERQQDQKHLADMMQRERERHVLEKQQQEKAEHERLKASILKHNTSSCLNTTVSKDTSPTCYDITPQRVPLPSTLDNYNIDDLHSGDSTDEEDEPRKIIPSWAQGAAIKAALIKQHYHPPPNLETMFGPIIPPDLTIIFAKKKSRYLKRTSSAVWDSPLLKV